MRIILVVNLTEGGCRHPLVGLINATVADVKITQDLFSCSSQLLSKKLKASMTFFIV